MTLVPVKSSNIAAVGYDPAARLLRLRFQDGATHDYRDVPDHVHLGLMQSGSKGRFFHARIRDLYASSKVEVAE